MKFRPTLSAYLLAFTLSCPAEEPNPFINQEPKKATPEASGDSFINLTEHILVPADLLDAWLEKHPLNEDASDLRDQVQIWIEDGSAQLDQTAISTGTAGREFYNSSVLEQIYATEFIPPSPGEWPMPTAFEARNLGYDISGGAGIEDGAMLLLAQFGLTRMLLPHQTWNELADRTRQPDDVFLPRFQSTRLEGRVRDSNGAEVSVDPFAEPTTTSPKGAKDLRFVPGKTYLVSRASRDLPKSGVWRQPDSSVEPKPLDPDHLEHLIFFRGAVLDETADSLTASNDIHHVSVKLVRVDHKTLSRWLQANELSTISDLSWAASSDWIKSGTAASTSNLTSPHQAGSASTIGNIVEVSYPTEWDPGKRSPASEGKPSQQEPSSPSAFETRNVGTELQTEIVSDPKGAILKLNLERGVQGGKSVHHRILRNGNWVEDITFPVFSLNRWSSELRVKRGEWMLVGSGSEIDAKGQFDSNHSVLAFIKLD